MLKTVAVALIALWSAPALAGDFDSILRQVFDGGGQVVHRQSVEVPSERYAVDNTYPADSVDIEDGAVTEVAAIYEPPADVNGDGLITEVEAHDYWVAMEAAFADDPQDPMVDE